jgi:hypothetical protein
MQLLQVFLAEDSDTTLVVAVEVNTLAFTPLADLVV